MATVPHTSQQPLLGEQRTDIAIIGAGFTGLWTSLFLKELSPGIEVAVVEKNVAGYGGSGRNAGILGETIDHSHPLAIAHFGLEEARRLAVLGKQNIQEMTEFFALHQIDCEFEPVGRLLVALTDSQLEEAKRNIDVAWKLGATGIHFLDAEQMQREIHSPLYKGGISDEGGGILNPMKLITGLKRVALQRGVRIYEHSPVERPVAQTIRSGEGSLNAGKIILATDAYTHHLMPELLPRFIPLYDYILVSEHLTPAQQTAIGWKRRQGVTDGRTFFNYYRLTADNRVLWGTSEAAYYSSNKVEDSCDHSETHYSALQDSFRNHFPQLAELKFEFAWGGPIASTTRLTPFFGSLQKERILYALGYTGHGLGSTRIAGKILAHLALEKKHELLDLKLVRQKPLPFPPEPLRSIAVNAVTRSLRQVDLGGKPNLLLRVLDKLGIGFSS